MTDVLDNLDMLGTRPDSIRAPFIIPVIWCHPEVNWIKVNPKELVVQRYEHECK